MSRLAKIKSILASIKTMDEDELSRVIKCIENIEKDKRDKKDKKDKRGKKFIREISPSQNSSSSYSPDTSYSSSSSLLSLSSDSPSNSSSTPSSPSPREKSPIKRKTQVKRESPNRRTPVKRKSPLKEKSPIKRGSPTPNRRTSARKRNETPNLSAINKIILNGKYALAHIGRDVNSDIRRKIDSELFDINVPLNFSYKSIDGGAGKCGLCNTTRYALSYNIKFNGITFDVGIDCFRKFKNLVEMRKIMDLLSKTTDIKESLKLQRIAEVLFQGFAEENKNVYQKYKNMYK